MLKNIVIPDPKRLEDCKKAISKEGTEKIHVISDFDRTLTYAFVKGEYVPSLISVLRDGKYLTPDYAEKAHALFNKYHPIETDLNIPLEKKKKAMQEWWSKHFELIIESGLNKKDLKKIVQSEKIKLRGGALEFFDLLHKYNIPLIIMSSAGLGVESISMYLEKENSLYDNIHIISNAFKWDKNGNAIGIREPIIHSMNKDEIIIKDFPKISKSIKNRKNILLLGDSVVDVNMSKEFDYSHIIKIGFLNKDVEKNLPHYKKNFDVIISNDSDMKYVNKLIKEIVE